MIARHEGEAPEWVTKLAAPLPAGSISWRQDGRPIQRDGKFFARFVAYVDAQTVRERLDATVPGEWDLTLEMLPTHAGFADTEGEAVVAFKARLQVLGVIREDVGQGPDFKQASTDAFKRAAVRFGVAHELYSYGQNRVQVDGDGKYAKPLEDPGEAYTKRQARTGMPLTEGNEKASPSPKSSASSTSSALPTPVAATGGADDPSCPKCGNQMWDNRISKRNPKAPDFKCRSRSCDGVVWPARGDGQPDGRNAAQSREAADDRREPLPPELDELPF